METTKRRIEEIKAKGYGLDFSDTFNHAFETYKKIALQGGLALLLFVVILAVLVTSVVTLFFGIGAFGQGMVGFRIGNLSALNQILYILGMALLSGVINPFTAGLLKMAHAADTNEDFSVGTAFIYYKGDKFLDLFLSGLLIASLSVGLNSLFDNVDFFMMPFISAIVNIIISFFTLFTIPLIILGNLKAIDAIMASCTVVAKNSLLILGLWIVAYILGFVGIIVFCLGVLFTWPFISSMTYSIYKEAVGTEEVSEIDEIGNESY